MAEKTEKAAKNKKLNKMKPAELDAKLAELKNAQGGLKSKHALMLIRRKKTLGK